MPGQNGLQIVKKLRKFLYTMNLENTEQTVFVQEPKFIFLSSFVNQGFKKTLQDLQITEVYEKPITPEKLIQMF